MENSGQPIKTGLYDLSMLGEFQRRQAWQHEFQFPLQYETMQVGDTEQISFHRRREPLIANRNEAEMSLIENVVSTGTVPREYYSTHIRLKTDVEEAEKRAQNLDGNATRVLKSLQAAQRSIEAMIDDVRQEKIKHAAGYIVARSNLWVVTHTESLGDTTRESSVRVYVARLTGLTKGDSVLPVVVGKNGVTTYANRPPYDRRFGAMSPMKVLRSEPRH